MERDEQPNGFRVANFREAGATVTRGHGNEDRVREER